MSLRPSSETMVVSSISTPYFGMPFSMRRVSYRSSEIVTAPAAFRFTYEAARERHHQVARLLAGEPVQDADADTLPDVLRALMRDVGAPRGIAELGYDGRDVPALVEGALKQQRLLVVSPRKVTGDDLGHILNASMTNW